jgi:hypothetical protein
MLINQGQWPCDKHGTRLADRSNKAYCKVDFAVVLLTHARMLATVVHLIISGHSHDIG